MIQNQRVFPIIPQIAAIFLFLSSISPAASQTLLARENVLEDARTTERLLKKYHPNLYAHRTAKQIKSIWDRAKSRLPAEPSFLDAATLAQRMLAAVCDEHTLIQLDEAWMKSKGRDLNFFPSDLVVLKDRLYLDGFRFDRKVREIVSINERSSDEIIEFLKAITSADGCQKSDVLFSRHNDRGLIVSTLLTNFLEARPKYDLKLRKSPTGYISNSSLLAVNLGVLWQLRQNHASRGRTLPLESIGIETTERDWEAALESERQLFVRSNADKSVFYIYLPSFNSEKTQAEAIDEEMRALVVANPDHVIVDLMDNPGGQIINAQRFMSYFLRTSSRPAMTMRSRVRKTISEANYIWESKAERRDSSSIINQFKRVKRRKGQYRLNVRSKSFGNKSYRGNLAVLISPNTHSAATFAATTLKRKAGAKIVGDIGDASMKTYCGSSPGAHPLPNSNIGLRIPLICGDRHPSAKRKGNLNKPDVPVDIAKQSSGKLNAAIFKAVINSLNLTTAAERHDSSHSAKHSTNFPAGSKLGFEISKRTIPVNLSRHPYDTGAAWLGLGLLDIKKSSLGVADLNNGPAVLISKVYAGSPADKAGLRPGNILLSVGGTKIYNAKSAMLLISEYRQGDRTTVRLMKLADTTEDFVSILHAALATPENRKMASFVLGNLYFSGDFGPENKKDSVRLLKIAVDAGSSRAAELLGYVYSGNRKKLPFTVGNLAAKSDFGQAMKYFTRAAALGDTDVMYRLASLYDQHKRSDAGSDRSGNKRVRANSELAALYLLHSYQRRNQKAKDELFETPYRWSKGTRVAMKKLLWSVGSYSGTLDGEIDEGTRRAIVRLRVYNTRLPDLPQ